MIIFKTAIYFLATAFALTVFVVFSYGVQTVFNLPGLLAEAGVLAALLIGGKVGRSKKPSAPLVGGYALLTIFAALYGLLIFTTYSQSTAYWHKPWTHPAVALVGLLPGALYVALRMRKK